MHVRGKGVSAGVAIAPVQQFTRTELITEKVPADDLENELARFESARALAATQLGQLAVELGAIIGEQNSLLFEIHQMMLEDLDYKQSVESIVKNERVSAEYAVSETARQFAAMFSEMDDAYMNARAADVQDVSRRVLEILSGRQKINKLIGQPVILMSNDFAPSETAQFDRAVVKGLITTEGSSNSHTAIFARTMGIPAVIGVPTEMLEQEDGLLAAVDGETGDIYLDPSDEILERCKQKQRVLLQESQELERYRGVPSVTRNGQCVRLYANIGNVEDAELAVSKDAEGVGLFRSEFLYLESKDYPSEEKQFEAYKAVAEKMDGKQVIIRTLDIGADKQADYFELTKEENPALGMRAIRICLTRPAVFQTQIRALLRASAYGNIGIMLPMITSVNEVRRAKGIIREMREELERENVEFDRNIQIGIMVETPAAAVISDLLAKEVDFFSIGTNDLTQYTLAVDRMNSEISEFCDEHHEAVLRLIQMTAEHAHENGIWVGICGELGADLSLTERFLEMGIDELSVNPSSILALRKRVTEIE